MRRNRQLYAGFLQAIARDEDLVAKAAEVLAPLIAYDAQHNGDLIGTLSVYFGCNLNASKAAETLFLHRNGFLYRLSRVEELLGVPLSDPAVRLSIEVAVRIAQASDAMA